MSLSDITESEVQTSWTLTAWPEYHPLHPAMLTPSITQLCHVRFSIASRGIQIFNGIYSPEMCNTVSSLCRWATVGLTFKTNGIDITTLENVLGNIDSFQAIRSCPHMLNSPPHLDGVLRLIVHCIFLFIICRLIALVVY